MSVYDSVKKIMVGDVAHDAADSGNPLKIGGKAKSSEPAAVAGDDRVQAYFDLNGRLATIASGKHTSTDVDQVSANAVGPLRITQHRELIVSPNHLRTQYFSNTVVPAASDITTGVAAWYNATTTPVATFFDGTDAGFTASVRYVQVPMFRFARGANIGIFNNLGVSLGLKLRARITNYNGSNDANGYVFYDGSVLSGAYAHFSPLPLHASAGAVWNYVPMLSCPVEAIVLELTPASDPSTGYFILTVGR